jgi:glutamate-1-semialdehyde 2,1-aminomutase
LIAAGSGAITLGVPNSPGVTKGVAKDTITAKYNDIEGVKALFSEYENEIAALIVEPVAGNMGCVLPENNFLQDLRDVCDANGTLLIFDEVMTGFRLAKGGAQEVYGVNADISTFGKIIGGGMPVGAYAGRKELMDYVAPAGPVYQAGTLSGNPIAMSAGLSILNTLNDNPEIYTGLASRTEQLEKGFKAIFEKLNLPYTINRIGSMMNIFFTDKKVRNFDDAKTTDTELFGTFFQGMLQEGIYLPPSQYETWFISTQIGEIEIEKILSAAEKVLKQL